MRRFFALALALTMLLLTGCGVKSGDEFYSLPKISNVNKSLESCLQGLLDSGLEYSAPISGTNARPVILTNLDSDSDNEAIAFFKDPSGENSPLKIYFFERVDEDTYRIAGHISGDGAAINRAVTCNIAKGIEMAELVVSWQISSGVFALSAYSLSQSDGTYAITEMMPSTSYTRYALRDMNNDGDDELVMLTLDPSDNGSSFAHFFDEEGGYLNEVSSAPLSDTMDSVDKLHSSTLADGTPAIYVTGVTRGDGTAANGNQAVTDVLALRGDQLLNVSLDASQRSSVDTTRYNLTPDQDINGDGTWEIPIPRRIDPKNPNSSDTFYAVDWMQYDLNGTAACIYTTYYNSTDGWYLELPNKWLKGLRLERSDFTEGRTNERGIIFYHVAGDDEPEPFFALYKNTGNDQSSRSTMDERMLLLSTQDATYSVKFYEADYDCGLDSNELFGRFHQITTDWSAN